MDRRIILLCAFCVLIGAPTFARATDMDMPAVAAPTDNQSISNDEMNEVAATPCGAQFADMIGQPLATIDQKRFQDFSLRILRPNQSITREYMDGRINVHVDGRDNITAVTCG